MDSPIRSQREEGVGGGRRPAPVIAGVVVRASVRHLRRHPGQLALSVLGIALGVAVVVAVELCIDTAKQAYRAANDVLVGRATHRIVGAGGSLDERLYVRLRLDPRPFTLAPVIEASIRTEAPTARTFTLVGVDPLAEASFRAFAASDTLGESGAFARLLTTPGGVLLDPRAARALGATRGSRIPVRIGGRRQQVVVVGLLEPRTRLEREQVGSLMVADLASAQELAGMRGVLSRVDVVFPPEAARGASPGPSVLAGMLPPGARLVEAGEGRRATERLTAAFELNLRMLALLALLVGAFLIYNTMTFSVVQRRPLIGSLRALGLTRIEVFRLVIVEAAAIGAVGAVLGAVSGQVLAGALLDLVTTTVSDHYFAVDADRVAAGPGAYWPALTGWLLCLAAASAPALEAARTTPRIAMARSSVERGARGGNRSGWVGALLLSIGVAVLAAPVGGVGSAFAGLLAVVGGAALLAPVAARLITRAAIPVARRLLGPVGGMAVRGVNAISSRSAVAVAALMVAISATIGVGVMVESFRGSVERWLGQTLQADIYIGLGSRAGTGLPGDLAARLASIPGVAATSEGRRLEVETRGGPVGLLALRPAPMSFDGFDVLGSRERARLAFESDAVLVSEPLAYRRDLQSGDEIEVFTGSGWRAFPVAGIYRDYGSERGQIVIRQAVFERHWAPRGPSAIGLYLVAPAGAEQVLARARALIGPDLDARARSNVEIREASLAVFDRTFAITSVLRMLALLIAFVGVLSALMAIEIERAREIAVLRVQGLTRAQVWLFVQTQTVTMGALSGVLAIPLGLALAVILVEVINRRSFGWSMGLHVDPVIPAQALALAIGAAFLAGLYPAWRMARTDLASSLRDE